MKNLFNKAHTRLLIILLTLITVCFMLYSFYVGQEITEYYTPLAHATMEIKLETTAGHLVFEEILSGDSLFNFTDVIKHISRAEDITSSMLVGGKIQNDSFRALKDTLQRRKIEQTLIGITNFRFFTEERWKEFINEEIDKTSDRQYDNAFKEFLLLADEVENELLKSKVDELNKFRIMQYFLITLTILFGIIISMVTKRNDLRREKYIQEIREGENFNKAITQTAADAIVSINLDGIVNSWNNAAEQIFGYSSSEMLGSDLSNIVPSRFCLSHNSAIKRLKGGGKEKLMGKPLELAAKRKNGEEFPVELTFSSWNSNGKKNYTAIIRDITERKQIETDLRKSEEWFSTITEQAVEGITVSTLDGDYVFVNNSFSKMMGYSKDELLKMNVFDMKKEEGEKAKEGFEKSKSNDTGAIVEVELKRKDGTTFISEVVGKPINIDDKNLVLGVVNDITERKEAEKELYESNERFRTLYDNSPDMYLSVSSSDNSILLCNKTFLDNTGYSLEEIIGSPVFEIYSDDSINDAKQGFEKFKEIGELDNLELVIVKKDSSNLDVSVKVSSVKDEEGRILYSISCLRDISKSKKRKLQIQKLSNAIEQTPVSIIITNVDGIIEYVNPKFVEITGYSYEEAINQNPNLLKSGEQSSEYYKDLWKTILLGKVWSGEFHNIRKNGELFWESAIISPIKDKNGKVTHFVAIKEDITEKKKMIDELVLSKERAENADKMKSIFLAQMSHEIRTPINTLVSMSSLLRYDFEGDATRDQLMSFDIIDRAGGRIIRTIDLLLNLSEIQAGTYEINLSKFDIFTDVISQIVAENKMLAKNKNIELNLVYSIQNSELVADHYTVMQIFTQLIDNAIKYTEKGKVDVKILLTEAEKLVIEIEDTGIGIEKKYLHQIFEPFTQVEMGYTRKYEGNGIGLALVKKYCELNNITIEVESEKNVGSTFRVVF